MKQYLVLLDKLLNEGNRKGDRTGTGTRSVFGYQMRFDLAEGFPLVTTKKMFIKGTVAELLWFISGSTNCNDLPENVRHWWTPWADENGNLGPTYGEQFRQATWVSMDGTVKVVDQLKDTLDGIIKDPNSRRHIISLWHTPAMNQTNLPCCHGTVIQFYVNDGKLSCQMYQRSADTFIGLPVNIASYALLTHMMAQQAGLGVGEFIWTGGDVHLYENHVEQAWEQLRREPFPLPTLILNKAPSLFEYKIEDFVIDNYECHPAIKAPVAI